jgi:hypothetical protein
MASCCSVGGAYSGTCVTASLAWMPNFTRAAFFTAMCSARMIRLAFDVDGVAHEGVDDFHERVLDGLFVFDHRDGMEARLWRATDAAVGVLVEVAELLSAESGGVATDSGDFDMSASVIVGLGIYLF